MRTTSFPKKSNGTTKPLEKIYSDLYELMKVESNATAKYFITLTNDHLSAFSKIQACSTFGFLV